MKCIRLEERTFGARQRAISQLGRSVRKEKSELVSYACVLQSFSLSLAVMQLGGFSEGNVTVGFLPCILFGFFVICASSRIFFSHEENPDFYYYFTIRIAKKTLDIKEKKCLEQIASMSDEIYDFCVLWINKS